MLTQAHAELHMFASAPHGYDNSPDLNKISIGILGTFFDRVFRSEGEQQKPLP